METITVKTFIRTIPTPIVGRDEQGRTLVRCPTCGADATILDGGRVSCGADEAISAYLEQAGPVLDRAIAGLFA